MKLGSVNSSLPQMNEQNVKRDKELEKIATARQIAMEDSASRSIASQMQNQVSSFTQELLNINDSIAMMQISDGALSTLSNHTQTLNDLSVRNNSAILNSADKQALQNAFSRTQNAMQDIINTTSFNEISLLDSSVSPKNLTIDNQEGIFDYSQSLASKQSDVGSAVNNYISNANTLLANITNSSAAKSQISDADIAKTIRDFQQSDMRLSASQLAMAHQTQTLQQSIGRLLG